MYSGSWIELSRPALENNVRLIKSILGTETRFSSVIKGNAYGHGISEMLGQLQEMGVDHFSVFNSEEAWLVQQDLQPGHTLMIMGDVDGDALAWAIENGVEYFVFNLGRLENSIRLAARMGRRARIHLEMETGMNRTGLSEDELRHALELIQSNLEWVEVCGCCTHFAGAESIANYYRIKKQISRFKKRVEQCRSQGIGPGLRHTSCSAGILRYPRMNLDLARVGILQYGHWPNPETMIEFLTRRNEVNDPLQRVLSWKSRVMSVKEIRTGEFIGYGSSFQATAPMKVAVVPVGYAYGYSRSLSNHGHVLIRDMRAPVVGMVNMNAITVDITGLSLVGRGEEVILIGTGGENTVSVSSFGEMSKQLNYELLARLPHSIPRIVKK
ncbi:MAG: alanine racemase [Bacteroidia bacterium]|nr:alanine racemase [Bacteroidia bacterium]